MIHRRKRDILDGLTPHERRSALHIKHFLKYEQELIQEVINLARTNQIRHFILSLSQNDLKRYEQKIHFSEKNQIEKRLKILDRELFQVVSLDPIFQDIRVSSSSCGLWSLPEIPALSFLPRLFY